MTSYARIVQRARQLVVAALTERSTPARLGWAVGLGCVVGSTPFYGFHLPLCVAVATLFRVNRAVTYFGANISIPPLLPFILFGSLQLGTLVLDGHWLPIRLSSMESLDPWTFAEHWLVGGVLLGSMIGAVLGLTTYAIARRYRRDHPLPVDPLTAVFHAVAERYAKQGRFVLGYVRGKLKHDPVYRQLAALAPHAGPLVDIDCGRGQASLLLKGVQPTLQIIASDWDLQKLARAESAALGVTGISFIHADARTQVFPRGGTLLMIDGLHYNPRETQDDMLRRAATALAPGGTLYVRDVDAEGGAWARVNIWQEKLGRAIRFNRGATLCFRPASELEGVLAGEGLDVRRQPSADGLPLANVLIMARRPA